MARIAAVVRDSKGRFVRDLTVRDFEVLESAAHDPSAICRTTWRASAWPFCLTSAAAWKVTCRTLAKRQRTCSAGSIGLNDEAAVYTFDTHLDERAPFTAGLRTLPDSMTSVVPFGATSLHDAIARTARRVGEREGRRRAVVVFTDGNDNASRLNRRKSPPSPARLTCRSTSSAWFCRLTTRRRVSDASAAAPFALVRCRIPRPGRAGSVLRGRYAGARSIAARQIVEELRHQYVIAFESSGKPGWHPLVVRATEQGPGC